MSQKCQECGKAYKFEFSIRDEIWDQLHESSRGRILCLECFLDTLCKANPRQKITINDFIFLGILDPSHEEHDGFIPLNPDFGGILLDRVVYNSDNE
jgi:hypothetical protein